MPELGSKISLISKADIRYEGRLFTVDPQECTIALANGEFHTFLLRNFHIPRRFTCSFVLAARQRVQHLFLFYCLRLRCDRANGVKKEIPFVWWKQQQQKRKEREVKWSVSHTHVNLHHRRRCRVFVNQAQATLCEPYRTKR